MDTNTNPVQDEQYPFLSDRVQSTFIDTVFIVVLMFLFASMLDDTAPDWIRIVLFFGIWAVYEPLSTSLGGTLGNYMKGIRVRRHKDTHRKINFFQAFFRYLFKIGLGWISFLTIHGNPQRRAIHDLVTGSVMIRADK